MSDKYLNLKELCEYLSITKPTAYKLIKGGLPYVMVGEKKRYSTKDIDSYLKGTYKAPKKEKETKPKVIDNQEKEFLQACKHIIEYLNEKGNGAYQWKAKGNQDLIKARFKDGYTIQDFELVIDYKCFEWLNDKKMNKFIQPSTLFNKKNFTNYIQQANTQLKREENKPVYMSDEMIIEMAKKGEL